MDDGFAGRLRQGIARLRRDVSGSVLTMFAVMLTVLAGFVALAIDVGLWYTTQQRMQHAADAAALAGALELAKPGYTANQVVAAAEQGAAFNRFEPAEGTTVAVAIASDERSVAVEISAIGPMALANLFLSEPALIAARAVAGLRLGDPICLLALDPTSPTALYLDSNVQLLAPECAVHVNSSSSTALHLKSNSAVEAASVCVTGDYRDESTGNISPAPENGCPSRADPLAGLEEPEIGGCDHNGLVLDNKTQTLNPGVYCNGLEIKGNSNITFNPGTYIIKDKKFFVDSNSSIQGSGVSFYLKGKDAVVQFNSNTVVDLSASTSGSLAGILFFHGRTVSGTPVHRIDSNSDNKRLEGMLYFPAAKLLVDSNGTVGGSSPCTLMIARQFEFNSNAKIKLAADPDACPVPMPTAYTAGTVVRLME